MIGIQLQDKHGIIAVWKETGPEVVGTAFGLGDLVAMACSVPGIDSSRGAVAVPACYNDEQRADLMAQAREAGITRPQLIKEPTAAALAFALRYF